MQHGGGAHRRQQQHGRFRGQCGQLGQPARPGGLGREQDQRRFAGQQHRRAAAQVGRGTVHRTQAQYLRIGLDSRDVGAGFLHAT